jgi:hypothetical protein
MLRVEGIDKQGDGNGWVYEVAFCCSLFVSLEAVSWRLVPGFDTGVEAWIITLLSCFRGFCFGCSDYAFLCFGNDD